MTTTRPLRADALRNRDRLLAVAEETFAAEGPEASLNEIAKRAGVGPGTLYRHFPTRQALQTAVLKDRIERLCAQAEALSVSHSPAEALTEWARVFLLHARTGQGMGGTLFLEETADLGMDCHAMIENAAAGVLGRAQRAGAARADLSPGDFLQLVTGIALTTVRDEESGQAERLLGLVLDAVRG